MNAPSAGNNSSYALTTAVSRDPHDWVVHDDLLIPTHRIELCALCRAWLEHVRSCTEFGREDYDRAREAARNEDARIASDGADDVDDAGDADELRLEAEIRLDESRRHNEAMLGWIVDRGEENRRFEADNIRLQRELTALHREFTEASDHRDELDLKLSNTRSELRDAMDRVDKLRERCSDLRDQLAVAGREGSRGPTPAREASIISVASDASTAPSTGHRGKKWKSARKALVKAKEKGGARGVSLRHTRASAAAAKAVTAATKPRSSRRTLASK